MSILAEEFLYELDADQENLRINQQINYESGGFLDPRSGSYVNLGSCPENHYLLIGDRVICICDSCKRERLAEAYRKEKEKCASAEKEISDLRRKIECINKQLKMERENNALLLEILNCCASSRR